MTDYLIAHSRDNQPIHLHSQLANRHGLIAGATGTGKTVTLRKLAEAFSQDGVPVFMADVKGDLSGICRAGKNEGKVAERMTQYDLPDDYLQAFPVRFWDVYGETGIPVRVSISAMGAMLLARLMTLNDTQEGVLNLVFKVADDKGWHLIDLKDLRGVLRRRRPIFRRTRAQPARLAANRKRARHHQHPQRRKIDALAAFIQRVYAVVSCRIV